MYDFKAPLGQRLTVVSQDTEPSDGLGLRCFTIANCPEAMKVVGISDDGRYVYFATERGHLTPDSGDLGNFNIYVWHEGVVRYVGAAAIEHSDISFAYLPSPGGHPDARVDPLGTKLLFATGAENPPFPDGGCGAFGCHQVF